MWSRLTRKFRRVFLPGRGRSLKLCWRECDDIRLVVDEPGLHQRAQCGDVVTFSGWAVAKAGVAAVRISIDDGSHEKSASLGFLRPDVAQNYPDHPGAGRSGFFSILNVAALDPGEHTARVLVEDKWGREAQWQLSFTKSEGSDYARWTSAMEALRSPDPPPGLKAANVAVVISASASATTGALLATLQSLANQRLPPASVAVIIQADHPAFSDLSTLAASFDAAPHALSTSLIEHLVSVQEPFVMLLEAGDLAKRHMLDVIEKVLVREHEADFLYADEEREWEGTIRPVFKPGWSPHLLQQCNYVGRAWVVRTAVLRPALSMPGSGAVDVEGLPGFLSERFGDIIHIPDILVSISSGPAWRHIRKPPLRRMENGGLSIIIPTCLRDPVALRNNLERLTDARSPIDVEIILLVNNAGAQNGVGLNISGVTEIHLGDMDFNWSLLNNIGAGKARYNYLAFVNDDVIIEGIDQILILNDTLLSSGAGIVSPLLSYPDGSLQHTGIFFSENMPRHLFRFQSLKEIWPPFLIGAAREVSAVTGACLLTSRKCFEQVGGFAEDLPIVGNDVDYCLRAREAGYQVLIQPEAHFVHYEALSRDLLDERADIKNFDLRWRHLMSAGDPYFNPNLDSKWDDWRPNPAPVAAPEPRRFRSNPRNAHRPS